MMDSPLHMSSSRARRERAKASRRRLWSNCESSDSLKFLHLRVANQEALLVELHWAHVGCWREYFASMSTTHDVESDSTFHTHPISLDDTLGVVQTSEMLQQPGSAVVSVVEREAKAEHIVQNLITLSYARKAEEISPSDSLHVDMLSSAGGVNAFTDDTCAVADDTNVDSIGKEICPSCEPEDSEDFVLAWANKFIDEACDTHKLITLLADAVDAPNLGKHFCKDDHRALLAQSAALLGRAKKLNSLAEGNVIEGVLPWR